MLQFEGFHCTSLSQEVASVHEYLAEGQPHDWVINAVGNSVVEAVTEVVRELLGD